MRPGAGGQGRGRRVYLQPLKPLAVGVHEPRPLCGTRARSATPSPAGIPTTTRAAVPSLAPSPAGRAPAQARSPGCPYLVASSSPPQSQTGGQIQGRCVGKNKSRKTPHLSLQHSLESPDEAFPEPAERARIGSGESYRPWSSGGLGNPRSGTRAGGGGEGSRVHGSLWQGPQSAPASRGTCPNVPPKGTESDKGERKGGGRLFSMWTQQGPGQDTRRGTERPAKGEACSVVGGLAGKAQGRAGVPLPQGPWELLQHSQTESPGPGAQGARGAPSHRSPQAPSKAPPSPNFKHQVLFASSSIVLSLGLGFYV